MTSPLCTPHEHRLSRRQWLGAVGLAGLLQPALAETVRNKHRQVLLLWLDGGISQLESWDPKPNSRFGGPFRAIPTSVPGIHVSELLPCTAQQMHHLALLRSLCTRDNSHSAGVDRIQRGDPKNRGVVYPYLGSAVARLLGHGDSGLPAYVWIKPGGGGFMHKDAGFLGPKYGSVAFGDGKPPDNLGRPPSLDEADDLQRRRLRLQADRRYARRHRKDTTEANEHVYEMAAQLQKRIDLFAGSSRAERDADRYGSCELGRHLLLGRRMLEAGVTFVKVTSYGWDTHGDNFNAHASLVAKLDRALAAFIEDLAARGMLEHVLVIVLSEFGRTPRINGHVGRDHWPEAWSAAMAGCSLARGVAVGKTNAQGTWVTSAEHDIGHLFHTWFSALGIASEKTEYDNHGQPLPIAHEDCYPIKELLAGGAS